MSSGLPVLISGEAKRILGLSKSTEVSHVLEVLQRTCGLKIPTRSLTLLERWREMETPLRSSEPILERWNSWGEEKSHVSYVLKRRKSDGKRKLRRRSFKTSEFMEEAMLLQVLNEEDFCQFYENDRETLEFIEAVRLHVSDLEQLSAVNSRLEEEELKIQQLLLQLSNVSPNKREKKEKEEEDLATLEYELKIQRRDNTGLEALIQVNADKIDYFRERLQDKTEEIRGLEYDFNVVEKEGRKLERHYQRLINLSMIKKEEDEEDPSSSGFSSAVSYDNDSSLDLDEALETFV